MQTGQSWTKTNHVPRCVKGLLIQGDGHQIISQNQAVGCASLYENLVEILAMEIPTTLVAEAMENVRQVAADGKEIVETVATMGLDGATRMLQVASNAQGLG